MDLIEKKRHPVAHRSVAYWNSSTGSIAIRDLTDRHLIQIVLYLYRTADKKQQEEFYNALEFAASFDSQTMASYEAYNIVDQLEDMGSGEYVEEILAPEVFLELNKRKIDIFKILNPPVRVIFDD